MVPHAARRRPIPARYRLVHGFVSALGATPVAVDPDAHDRLVAVTSHLPHALANLLVNQAGSSRIEGHDPLAAAGGSLRDMTRVAGANPRIWVDIFLENPDALLESLAEHRRSLEQLERALDAADAGYLARWIGEAAGNRRRMLAGAYPDPGELQRVRVHVPDRPGVFAAITQALGAERINIEDFEFHHVSPERGGTLTLLVTGEGDAARAADAARGPGLRRRVSRRRWPSEDRAGDRVARALARARATSRSRTAPCCSARSPRARRSSAASAARPTPTSTVEAVRALGVDVDEDDGDDDPRRTASACAACASPTARSTAATRARCCACSPASSPARRAASS